MHKYSAFIGPAMADKVKSVLEELENDPDYQKKYEELMERKRIEFRDREASRKLVG
ncbi:MAG: hypothetical protein ABIK83_11575 [Candidatus Zixiibacteriota bacterium]